MMAFILIFQEKSRPQQVDNVENYCTFTALWTHAAYQPVIENMTGITVFTSHYSIVL